MKSHPVEMASEVATLDPTRGVESTAVTPNAGGTKVEAVADTKTSKFHLLSWEDQVYTYR